MVYFADSADKNIVESTHQIRKKLKFFRAFVKLLKSLNDPKESNEVNVALRDFGKEFSLMRDARVRRLMLDELTNGAINSSFKSILFQLIDINETVINRLEQSMLREQNQFLNFKISLIQNIQINRYFVLNDPDPSAVLTLLSSSYMKSFNAFNATKGNLDPNLLHEWRKRLKDVQYQFELIFGNLNPDIQMLYLKIQDLCNILGKLNDWDMMNHWISMNRDKLSPKNSHQSIFFDELTTRHETFLKNAISSGDELYTFTPVHFRENLFIR